MNESKNRLQKGEGPSVSPLKIAVHGAAGKMGKALARVIAHTPKVTQVAALDHRNHDLIGKDIGAIAGLEVSGVLVTSELESALALADVVVDFSLPEAMSPLLECISSTALPLISGTTGVGEKTLELMQSVSTKVPIVFAPNMSIAMNVLFALTQKATRALGDSYDAEIIEWHHRYKEDAPSGTALQLGTEIALARGQELQEVGRFSRHGRIGPRKANEIGITAVRGGDIVGEHTVLFAGPNERLELSHRVTSRENFANGALVAAKWAIEQKPGLYNMQNVLGLK